MGAPVVTMHHPTLARGRATGALLAAMETTELIAKDSDDFVDIALKLGLDPAWYTEVSKKVRSNFEQAASSFALMSGVSWLRLIQETAQGKTPADLYAPKSRRRSTFSRGCMRTRCFSPPITRGIWGSKLGYRRSPQLSHKLKS